jgi:hypothetical protein
MKPQYRIRNWSEYNAGLKQRGSLTVWLKASVLEQWVVEALSGKPGACVLDSELAIQTMATTQSSLSSGWAAVPRLSRIDFRVDKNRPTCTRPQHTVPAIGVTIG